MQPRKLKYEFEEGIVNYILQALNKTQIAGVEQAQSLLQVVELLKNPTNKDDLEKETLETLKAKFEKKEEKKK